MPWKENRVEEQRLLMLREHDEGVSISELADYYGVARKTIYKWIDRYEADGIRGLTDQSRRPHQSPSQVSGEVEAAIVAMREHWGWGPRKLRVKLCQQDSERQWPAVSTIALVLKAKGLVVNRKRRAHTLVQKPPYALAASANDVWCTDFKGWFRTGDGARVQSLSAALPDCGAHRLRACQGSV